MRIPVHFLLSKSLLVAVIVYLTTGPVHAQRGRPTFRTAAWGMNPDAVQAVEPGTHLRTDSENDVGVERIDAYFDTIQGKIGTVAYGFHKGHLVYGAYRFKLGKDDRAFSQRMGEQMRSRYGKAERVEVSDDGETIQLHWSTPQTRVIAQFAPTALRVHFWETSHWRQKVTSSAGLGDSDG